MTLQFRSIAVATMKLTACTMNDVQQHGVGPACVLDLRDAVCICLMRLAFGTN